MRRFTLSGIFVVFLVLALHRADAQENQQRQLAEEILALTHVAERTQAMFDNLKQMQIAQIDKMKLPPEAHNLATAYRERLSDIMTQEMSWSKVKDDYVKVYADTFSVEELRGIVTFYKSPTGQALLAKTPKLLQQSTQVAQRHLQNIAPQIRELQKQMIEEAEAMRKAK
ncbi:MAG TPA: DUF2059 domain-containing protein [Candidatus Binatus sp.]|nr:DUF2059 domain-containing protein [Candidatus Binatus sp.]